MKKFMWSGALTMLMALTPAGKLKAQDPIMVIIKEGVTKVIKAVDLKIQRLQNETIWLQNAQKVIENTMSKLKLVEISEWVEKQKVLYEDYFEELWRVKDALAYYHRIRELTRKQALLIQEYKRAWNGVRQDRHFTPEEVLYIGRVYTGIIEESLKNLEQLSLVIHSFTTQMSDAGRLKIMDAAAQAMEKNYSDLKAFNTQNIQLSLQRARDVHDVELVRKLYGIQ